MPRFHLHCRDGKKNKVRRLLHHNGLELINKLTKQNESPLFYAAAANQLEVVNYLLSKGALTDCPRDDGATPLHIAAQRGHCEVLRALLQAGAPQDAPFFSGATPLHMAAENGHLSCVQCLVSGGATVNSRKRDGATPLFLAAQEGHWEVVRYLLDHGADLHLTLWTGGSPLHAATKNHHVSVMELLLAHGCDPNVAQKDGTTPLFVAAQEGHGDACRLLLSRGADCNTVNALGVGPFHVACWKGHEEVTTLLLCRGVDWKLRYEGLTGVHWAAKEGHNALARRLARRIHFAEYLCGLPPSPELAELLGEDKSEAMMAQLEEPIHAIPESLEDHAVGLLLASRSTSKGPITSISVPNGGPSKPLVTSNESPTTSSIPKDTVSPHTVPCTHPKDSGCCNGKIPKVHPTIPETGGHLPGKEGPTPTKCVMDKDGSGGTTTQPDSAKTKSTFSVMSCNGGQEHPTSTHATTSVNLAHDTHSLDATADLHSAVKTVGNVLSMLQDIATQGGKVPQAATGLEALCMAEQATRMFCLDDLEPDCDTISIDCPPCGHVDLESALRALDIADLYDRSGKGMTERPSHSPKATPNSRDTESQFLRDTRLLKAELLMASSKVNPAQYPEIHDLIVQLQKLEECVAPGFLWDEDFDSDMEEEEMDDLYSPLKCDEAPQKVSFKLTTNGLMVHSVGTNTGDVEQESDKAAPPPPPPPPPSPPIKCPNSPKQSEQSTSAPEAPQTRSVATECEECVRCLQLAEALCTLNDSHASDQRKWKAQLDEFKAQSKKATEHFIERLKKLKQQNEELEHQMAKLKKTVAAAQAKVAAAEEQRQSAISKHEQEREEWKSAQTAAQNRQVEWKKHKEQLTNNLQKVKQEKQTLEAARKELSQQNQQLEKTEKNLRRQMEALTSQLKEMREREAKASIAAEKNQQLVQDKAKELDGLRSEMETFKKAKEQQAKEQQQAIKKLRTDLETEVKHKKQRDREMEKLKLELQSMHEKWPTAIDQCDVDTLKALSTQLEAYRSAVQDALAKLQGTAQSLFSPVVRPPRPSPTPSSIQFSDPFAEPPSPKEAMGDYEANLQMDKLLQSLRSTFYVPTAVPW